MNTKRFTLTEGQQEELRACPYVQKVSARMVQYTADFKRHAIAERARGKPPRLIWNDAGIPYYFGPKYAADRINDWAHIVAQHGDAHFDSETRGQAQFVTGLSVFDGQYPRVPKHIKRKIRLQLHYIQKFGLINHFERIGVEDFAYEFYYNKVRGTVDYINAIEPVLAEKLYEQLPTM